MSERYVRAYVCVALLDVSTSTIRSFYPASFISTPSLTPGSSSYCCTRYEVNHDCVWTQTETKPDARKRTPNINNRKFTGEKQAKCQRTGYENTTQAKAKKWRKIKNTRYNSITWNEEKKQLQLLSYRYVLHNRSRVLWIFLEGKQTYVVRCQGQIAVRTNCEGEDVRVSYCIFTDADCCTDEAILRRGCTGATCSTMWYQ